ncbi:MAG: hypothetical protein ACHQJ6_03325 [Candidatus Berkiellales bacterium]
MPLLPVTEPLDGNKLIATICHLYRVSLLAVLLPSVLCAVLYHLIVVSSHILPHSWQQKHHNVTMFLVVLLVPLLAMIISIFDNVAKQKEYHFTDLILFVGQRFISFIGAIFSMLLFPAFILGIGIVIYFILLRLRVNYPFTFAWIIFICISVFAAFVPKVFALPLVISEKYDANNAIDTSELLVKGYYFRTFFHSFYALLLVLLLTQLPTIIIYYFPRLAKPAGLMEGISIGLLAIIGPWSFASLMTQQYDLLIRKKDLLNSTPLKKKITAPVQKQKMGNQNDTKKDDNKKKVSF